MDVQHVNVSFHLISTKWKKNIDKWDCKQQMTNNGPFPEPLATLASALPQMIAFPIQPGGNPLDILFTDDWVAQLNQGEL